uniref:E3 ubiquitin-protein ligase Sina-like RING finger domain-containing protein n=1 Tax=Oryza punctata TaxID=4537 RepID=A0A0E0KYL4_ORYPU
MASSSLSRRRAMAASKEGDASANARKKLRAHVEAEYSDSEEEERQGEPDGGGVVDQVGSESPPASTRAAVAGVTVADADALDCGMCRLPLRPPIFQCEVGHVVCSPCRDNLAPAGGKCHVCGVDSTAALLDHFAAAHGWLCTTKDSDGELFLRVVLHDGFNFLRIDHHAAAHHHLIMLNMTREPFGRAITALCIHPRADISRIQCELLLSRYNNRGSAGDGELCRSHYQKSVFDVEYSDLADELPDPNHCFQFMVPRCVVGVNDERGIEIDVQIIVD